jgi:hypothetical protein
MTIAISALLGSGRVRAAACQNACRNALASMAVKTMGSKRRLELRAIVLQGGGNRNPLLPPGKQIRARPMSVGGPDLPAPIDQIRLRAWPEILLSPHPESL